MILLSFTYYCTSTQIDSWCMKYTEKAMVVHSDLFSPLEFYRNAHKS